MEATLFQNLRKVVRQQCFDQFFPRFELTCRPISFYADQETSGYACPIQRLRIGNGAAERHDIKCIRKRLHGIQPQMIEDDRGIRLAIRYRLRKIAVMDAGTAQPFAGAIACAVKNAVNERVRGHLFRVMRVMGRDTI